MSGEEQDDGSMDEELANDVSLTPNETADPQSVVDRNIPEDIRRRFEVLSYRNAAVILSETRSAEFDELTQALRDFSITTTMIRTAGGNESQIPKILTKSLRPK